MKPPGSRREIANETDKKYKWSRQETTDEKIRMKDYE